MRILSIVTAIGLSLGTAAFAVEPDPVQQHNSNAVWFENWIGLSNATMVVAAPNGRISQVRADQGTPVYELDRAEAQDGVYRYELRAATEEEVEIVNPVNNGRGEAQTTMKKPFYRTGHFVVSRGVIITPEEIKEE